MQINDWETLGKNMIGLGFLGYLVYSAGEKQIQKHFKKKNIYANNTRVANIEVEKQRLCDEMKGYFGCSRVSMFSYSNSVTFFSPNDKSKECKLYVDCDAESLAAGVVSIKKEFDHKKVDGIIGEFILRIDAEEKYLRVSESTETGNYKVLQRLYGTTTSYNFKVDTKTVWNGVISLNWLNGFRGKEVVLTEEQLSEMEIYRTRLLDLYK